MVLKIFFSICLLAVVIGTLTAIPLDNGIKKPESPIGRAMQYLLEKYPELSAASDWDMFVFAQEWPKTVCSSSSHTNCAYPKDKDTWTVHGLWPSKGSSGPSNCDTDAKFSPEVLAPILEQLEEQWTNVFADTEKYSFWKHEWDKHGTCATELPELNTALKFFSKGLELNEEYNLGKILSDNNILPGNSYAARDFTNAIESVTGKTVAVRCASSGAARVQEIRICFDKEFNVIDCTGASNCKKVEIEYEGF